MIRRFLKKVMVGDDILSVKLHRGELAGRTNLVPTDYRTIAE
jgi:hypothetical protein